jgi:pyruvate,water dikinase
MREVVTLDEIGPADAQDVGGKALGLARLEGAGLPVPPGFVVTTAAYRRLGRRDPASDPGLCEAIASAYRRLGGGPVAVRSSATAEDSEAASFAGLQETYLGVEGEQAVCHAVGRCWESLHSRQAVAYRSCQGIPDDDLAMAVLVQRLVPALVAGVLFTHDPLDATGRGMLVEASWGLGEAVVSGKVTPDRYHIDRDSGAVRERHLGDKRVEVTPQGERPVDAPRRQMACLDEWQLAQLAALGRRVECLFGQSRDVEWAWDGEQFWLLQARPITAPEVGEREQVRRQEIAAAAALAEPGGTAWSRISLSESLPAPTPMTWAIVRRFMSGRGGFGLMYRDLGFRPPRELDEAGTFDLIAGRTYCNLSREPQMYSGWLPFVHPFDRLKADPRKALDPQPIRDPSRLGPAAWLLLPLRLPALLLRSVSQVAVIGRLTQTFADQFRNQIAPAFLAEVSRAAGDDLTRLDEAALLARLEHWVRRTLYDFARESLKPTALAAMARLNLLRWLARKLGPQRARAAVNELVMGVRPEPAADLAGAVQELLAGRLGREQFLEAFGHRGPDEMELACPRWAEDPDALASLPAAADFTQSDMEVSPEGRWERVAAEAGLGALQRRALDPQVKALHAYEGLREAGRHHLMRGYALIRAVLVELDRRHRLRGGLFYLTPDELPRLAAGEDLSGLIARRRRRRAVCLSLEAPAVLFSDDLEALGRPPPAVAAAESLRGVPLSAGSAEGPALVLHEPRPEGLPGQRYVLVCPSTDPAWVPLFAGAAALVMESGGVLSHGALVAREFGIPAVAGLPDVQRRLRTGQRLRVDGGSGTVEVLPG